MKAMKNKKKLIFSVICCFAFANTNIIKSSIKDLNFLLTMNSETLANAEAIDGNEGEDLWDKTKYTKIDKMEETRYNEEETRYQKHTITCEPGGIEPDCSPLCQTRKIEMGIATPWEDCKN